MSITKLNASSQLKSGNIEAGSILFSDGNNVVASSNLKFDGDSLNILGNIEFDGADRSIKNIGNYGLIFGTNNIDRLKLTSNGSLLLNSAVEITNVKFKVIGSIAIAGAETDSDSTNKNFRIGGLSYNISEEPVCVFISSNGATANNLNIGGGSSALNSATQIQFYTTPTVNTVSGTLRMSIDNVGKVRIQNELIHGNYKITKIISKTGLENGVSSNVFTITTTNESGSTDGGVYSCIVRGIAFEGGENNITNSAVKVFEKRFVRALSADGSNGVNISVENDFTSLSAATSSSVRDIDTITMAVTETSEFVQTVSFTLTFTGSTIITGGIRIEVEVFYYGFLTIPEIATA